MKIVRTEIVSLKEALDMLSVICQQTGTSFEDVRGKSRKRAVTESRFLCAYFLRKQLRMSLSTIGEIIDRDHTSVLHMVNESEGWIEHQDSSFYPKYRLCVTALKLPIKDEQIS